MKNILAVTLVIGLGFVNNLDACEYTWTKNDSSYLYSLYKHGTHTEITAFQRYRRAQLNQCNNSKLDVNQMMKLHYKNDVSIGLGK